MDDGTLELPVFELPLALLPTESVPLHVFEERYKRMIGRCRREAAPFGILLRTDEGARGIGCAAALTEVIEEFEDGRLNVIVTGQWRFRVLERFEGPEFPLATVERIRDDPDPDADPAAAQAAFGELLDAVGAEVEDAPGGDSAYEIAARIEIPVEDKQELLEIDLEPLRLRLLERIIQSLSEQVSQSRKLAERARGNGHAPITGLGSSEEE